MLFYKKILTVVAHTNTQRHHGITFNMYKIVLRIPYPFPQLGTVDAKIKQTLMGAQGYYIKGSIFVSLV